MKFLIIRNCPTEGPGLVAEFLQDHGIECAQTVATDFAALDGADDFDGLAVFGSPESCVRLADDSPFQRVQNVMARFAQSDRPVLGVCFGGQLLARALGARVRPCAQPEIGCYTVALTAAGRSSPFFEGVPDPFPAAQWHSDSFDVPDGATLLASSPQCPNQAFAHGRSLGLQFHPEITFDRGQEWAEEYAGQLERFGKSPDQVRAELAASHTARAELCERLVDNFVRVARGSDVSHSALSRARS